MNGNSPASAAPQAANPNPALTRGLTNRLSHRRMRSISVAPPQAAATAQQARSNRSRQQGGGPQASSIAPGAPSAGPASGARPHQQAASSSAGLPRDQRGESVASSVVGSSVAPPSSRMPRRHVHRSNHRSDRPSHQTSAASRSAAQVDELDQQQDEIESIQGPREHRRTTRNRDSAAAVTVEDAEDDDEDSVEMSSLPRHRNRHRHRQRGADRHAHAQEMEEQQQGDHQDQDEIVQDQEAIDHAEPLEQVSQEWLNQAISSNDLSERSRALPFFQADQRHNFNQVIEEAWHDYQDEMAQAEALLQERLAYVRQVYQQRQQNQLHLIASAAEQMNSAEQQRQGLTQMIAQLLASGAFPFGHLNAPASANEDANSQEAQDIDHQQAQEQQQQAMQSAAGVDPFVPDDAQMQPESHADMAGFGM